MQYKELAYSQYKQLQEHILFRSEIIQNNIMIKDVQLYQGEFNEKTEFYLERVQAKQKREK